MGCNYKKTFLFVFILFLSASFVSAGETDLVIAGVGDEDDHNDVDFYSNSESHVLSKTGDDVLGSSNDVEIMEDSTGDFDGDGNLDFITYNYFDPQYLSIAYGNGDGTFTYETDVLEGYNFKAFDYDQDGVDEIVYGDYYTPPGPGSSSAWSYDLIAADYPFQEPDKEYIFYDWTSTCLGHQLWDYELADFNEDGNFDVVLMTSSNPGPVGSQNCFSVYYGPSTAEPDNLIYDSPVVNYSDLFVSTDLEVSDLELDGDLDVVAPGHYSTPNDYPTQFFINDGSENFTIESSETQFSKVELEDINNDGYPDLSFRKHTSSKFYLNDGSGNFSYITSLNYDFIISSRDYLEPDFYLSDFNADGYPDVARYLDETSDLRIAVYENDDGAGFSLLDEFDVYSDSETIDFTIGNFIKGFYYNQCDNDSLSPSESRYVYPYNSCELTSDTSCGAETMCSDGLDNDCDGDIDCQSGNEDSDCPCGGEECSPCTSNSDCIGDLKCMEPIDYSETDQKMCGEYAEYFADNCMFSCEGTSGEYYVDGSSICYSENDLSYTQNVHTCNSNSWSVTDPCTGSAADYCREETGGALPTAECEQCLQDSHCPISGDDGVTGCDTDDYVCCPNGQNWTSEDGCEPALTECNISTIGTFQQDSSQPAGWRYCCLECALGYSYHCWYGTEFFDPDSAQQGGGGTQS